MGLENVSLEGCICPGGGRTAGGEGVEERAERGGVLALFQSRMQVLAWHLRRTTHVIFFTLFGNRRKAYVAVSHANSHTCISCEKISSI